RRHTRCLSDWSSDVCSSDLGDGNTAVGAFALDSTTTGTANVGIGVSALAFNTTGFYNTAVGYGTLFDNTTGAWNTATGFEALSKIGRASCRERGEISDGDGV